MCLSSFFAYKQVEKEIGGVMSKVFLMSMFQLCFFVSLLTNLNETDMEKNMLIVTMMFLSFISMPFLEEFK